MALLFGDNSDFASVLKGIGIKNKRSDSSHSESLIPTPIET